MTTFLKKLRAIKTKIGHFWYLFRIYFILMPVGNIIYLFRKITKKTEKPNIMSPVETLKYIYKNNLSCVRFGDGEMTAMQQKDHYFAKKNPELAQKLTTIIKSTTPSLLICLPEYAFYYPKHTPLWVISSWNVHLLSEYQNWQNTLTPGKLYGSAFISRIHDFKDHKTNTQQFNLWKKIFKNQNIIIVEGEHVRAGVKNDLLSSASSIKRILCPDSDSFSRYQEIKKACLRHATKNTLFLIALGQTAKPLVYDLAQDGYRALDIGHLDISYEWYLAGKRVKIPGKTVVEIKGDDHYEALADLKEYQDQIITKI